MSLLGFVCLLFDCVLLFCFVLFLQRTSVRKAVRTCLTTKKEPKWCLPRDLSVWGTKPVCVPEWLNEQHYGTFLKFVLCKCFHTYIWEGLYIFFVCVCVCMCGCVSVCLCVYVATSTDFLFLYVMYQDFKHCKIQHSHVGFSWNGHYL